VSSDGEHLVKSRAALDWLLAQHPAGLVEVTRFGYHDPEGWPSVRGSTVYHVWLSVPAGVDYDWPQYHYAISRAGGIYRLDHVGFDEDRDRSLWRVSDPEPVWRASWSTRRREAACA
jgi:hypothetical protein